MEQQKIGNFLKQLRKEKGLTQEQFAERFYISSRTVSRWETGSNMPDVDMLIELADFYEVDIREIIDVPTMKAVVMALHSGTSRKMKCPYCGNKSYHKKVLTK